MTVMVNQQIIMHFSVDMEILSPLTDSFQTHRIMSALIRIQFIDGRTYIRGWCTKSKPLSTMNAYMTNEFLRASFRQKGYSSWCIWPAVNPVTPAKSTVASLCQHDFQLHQQDAVKARHQVCRSSPEDDSHIV